MTWAHFVPAYDQWLDNTYVKQWGEANDVEVKVDHINNALLYSTGASEVAAQSGHDLFWFISPPSTFQKQAIPMTDLVQEVSKKVGPMSRVARKATYNPKTKQFYGFPETYAPDPVQYRKSFFEQTGVSLKTWEDVRKGAPKLKAIGHPVGLGMSNEIDSNMLLTSLLYCYGGFIQNEENRIVIGQGSNQKGRDPGAAGHARHLQERHVGRGLRLDCGLEQPGLPRRSALDGPERDLDRALSRAVRETRPSLTTPGSPRSRAARRCGSGNEHVMGVYLIWKFAKNKEAARKYVVDQQLNYREHFVRSLYYNFPPWTGAIKGGFKTIRAMTAQDTHKPKGKYTILTTIAEKYTTNPGHPGNTTPVMDEIYNTFLIPQMFAEVAQGKSTPPRRSRASRRRHRASTGSGRTRGSCSSDLGCRSRAPATGPSASQAMIRQLTRSLRSTWWPRSEAAAPYFVQGSRGRAGAAGTAVTGPFGRVAKDRPASRTPRLHHETRGPRRDGDPGRRRYSASGSCQIPSSSSTPIAASARS